MTAFEDFLQAEFPLRSTLLKATDTGGYDGDPNDGGAPAIISGAPLGTWFREETAGKWWRKTETTWEEQNTGESGSKSITSLGIATTEDMAWTVDYATGVSPPAGTIITTQAQFDALGAPLRYIQEVADIRPQYIDHVVTVSVLSGNQYAKPGTVPPLGAILYDYAPMFVSHKTPGFKVGAPFPFSFPGIYFVGATSDIDASVAGTLTVGDGESTFTRTAGTWTASALVGKRIDITSGVGAGTKAVIVANTTTELTVQTEASGSSGAATVRTYQLDTVMIPTEGPAGSPVFQSLLLGNQVSNPSWVPYAFIDIQLTRATDFTLLGVSNHQTWFYHSDVNAVSIDFTGLTRATFGGCNVNLISFGTGKINFTGPVGKFTINDTWFQGGNALGNFITMADKPSVVMISTRITPQPTFAGFCVTLMNGAILDLENGSIRIEGNGSSSGIMLQDTGGTNIVDDSGFLIIDNSVVAFQVDKGFLRIDGLAGSGNDLVYKVLSGSDVGFSRSAHTCTGTDFAELGGTLYAESNWTTSGDEVIGSDGSRLLSF